LGLIFRVNAVAGSGDATSVASAECFGLDLHAKTKMMFAAPCLVMLLPLPMLLKARLRRRATVFGVPRRHAYWAAVLVGWWLVHPAVLAHCVVTLLTLRVAGKDYALADLSIEASDPAYQVTRRLALTLMFTFVPAVPLYIFGQLYRWRDALRSDWMTLLVLMPEGPRIRLFYFYGSYAPARYYWEGAVFAVRTAMVLLSALSSTFVAHGKLQLIVFATTWVTLIHFLFVFKFRPYARDVENKINNVAQGALLALLLSALGLSLDEAKQESKGFESMLLTFCAALLIGTMGVLATAFVGQCAQKRTEKREQKAAAAACPGPATDAVAEDSPKQQGDEQAAARAPMFENPMHGQGAAPDQRADAPMARSAAGVGVALAGRTHTSTAAGCPTRAHLAATTDVRLEDALSYSSSSSSSSSSATDGDGGAPQTDI